jgi:hypothetical protein
VACTVYLVCIKMLACAIDQRSLLSLATVQCYLCNFICSYTPHPSLYGAPSALYVSSHPAPALLQASNTPGRSPYCGMYYSWLFLRPCTPVSLLNGSPCRRLSLSFGDAVGALHGIYTTMLICTGTTFQALTQQAADPEAYRYTVIDVVTGRHQQSWVSISLAVGPEGLLHRECCADGVADLRLPPVGGVGGRRRAGLGLLCDQQDNSRQ